MGRAKLNMELIKKEKARNATFHMRKNTLKNKVYQLATLCGIKAMVIIYGPKQDTQQARPLEPEIFPDNRDEVLELINKYKGQSPEDRKNKTNLLSDYFKGMIKGARKDLTSLRHTTLQSKYPTSDSMFSSFTENDLWRIVANLENKIPDAKAKLGQMKANNNSNNIDCAYSQLQQQGMLTKKRSRDFEEGNPAYKYRVTINPHQSGSMPMPVPVQIQQGFPFMDHYQDQRMVNFGRDNVGGASNIVYNGHPSQAVYNCPVMAGTVNDITYMNNLAREPPNYYGEGMQPTAQHFMQYHPMRPGSAPHQVVGTSHQLVATSHQADSHVHQMVGTSHQLVATSHQADSHVRFYQDRNWQR